MRKWITACAALVLAVGAPGESLAQSTYDEDDWFAWVQQGNFRPFLEASYGYAMPSHNGVESEFADVGAAELLLGFSEIEPYGSKYVVSIDERYAFGTYAASDVNPFDEVGTGQLDTKMFRFGIGTRLGYGYRIGPIEVLPYNQNGLLTTDVEWATRPAGLSPADSTVLDRIEGKYRGSMLAEPGFKVRLFKGLSAAAGYELQTVYTRFVFGEWMGSFLTQYAGQAALTYFADEIVNTSPVLGPLLYFVLKNGLSVAFYSLMRDDMFWPFESETPLTMETAKLSVSLTF